MKTFLVFLLLVSANTFAESVPQCDVTGSQYLNDPSVKVICLEEESNMPKITLSGTEVEPRHIIGGVVNKLYFINSSHWVVHKTVVNGIGDSSVRMQPGTKNITLDGVTVENSGGGAGQIALGGDNLVVQNSVIRNTKITPFKDDHCLVFYGKNVKVINNKIYNCAGDGIQISAAGAPNGLIEGNDLFVNSDYYTDGNGNFDPNGQFICGENAFDFKGGGTLEKPLIIRKNKIHGFNKPNDKNCVTGGGGRTAVVMHSKAYGIIFEENDISDSKVGVIAANPTVTRVSFIKNKLSDLDIGFEMPPSKAYKNKYIENTFHNVANPFGSIGVNEEIIEAEEDPIVEEDPIEEPSLAERIKRKLLELIDMVNVCR